MNGTAVQDGWQRLRGDEERRAGSWFAALTRLQPVPHDTGREQGCVDFEVVGRDRVVGVLEVTRHVDGEWRQRQMEIRKRAVDEDAHWHADCLTRYWTVSLDELEDYRSVHGSDPPPVKQLKRRLAELLAPFEVDPTFLGEDGVITVSA
jgi:hypothetical protein